MSTNRLRPLFSYKITVDSTKSYRTFFKHNKKLIHTLEINICSSAVINPIADKVIKRSLLKLAKKSKSIQSLRLHKCLLQIKDNSDSKLHSIRKLYRTIKSLFLSINGPSSDMMEYYSKWIIDSKRLTNLYFILCKYIEEDPQHVKSAASLQKFLHAIQRKKLQVIKVILEADYNEALRPFICFKNYPPTLRKLAINWSDYGALFLQPSLHPEESCLSHFKFLETLNLCLPLPTEAFRSSLGTISKSSNIIFLDLEPYLNHSPELQDNSQSLVSILQRFEHLNGITLKINARSSLFEALPSLLRELPLTKLKLEMLIHESRDLIAMGSSLGSLLKLKSLVLKIRNTKALDFKDSGCFESFFEDISKLKLLSKLKVYFTVLFQNEKTSKKVSSFLPALSNCVGELQNLEQLSFRFRQADFGKSSENLFNALMNRASEFKKLKINFGRQKLKAAASLRFNQLLLQMNHLETLNLSEYWFDGIESLKSLWESMKNMNYLKTLKFVSTCGIVESEALVNFIQKSLVKEGLQKFYLTCSSLEIKRKQEEAAKIDLKEAVDSNSDLQVVYVPIDIFKNSDDIFLYKWN